MRLLLIINILILNTTLFAQKADSLLSVLSTEKIDSSKVNILNALAEEFQRSDYSKSYNYAQAALAISKKIQFKKGEALSCFNIGYSLNDLSKNDSSLIYYFQSYVLYESLDDTKGMASAANDLGYVNRVLGKYDEALSFYKKSVDLWKKAGDEKGMASPLNNMAQIYRQRGQLEKAIGFYAQSLEIRKRTNDRLGEANTYNNLGSLYKQQNRIALAEEHYLKSLQIRTEEKDLPGQANSFNNLGSLYEGKKEYKKALEYYSKALTLQIDLGQKRALAYTYGNIGQVEIELGNPEAAARYFAKALDFARETNDKHKISDALSDLATLYLEKNDLEEAKQAASEAKQIGKELGSQKDIATAAKLLRDACEELGLFKEAYFHAIEYATAKDSLNSNNHQKLISELAGTYEAEKREQEILLLEKEKEIQETKQTRYQSIIRILIIGGGMSLLFFILLLRSSRQIRQKNEVLVLEKAKSDKLLLNILPETIAEELKNEGFAKAKRHESVTVLYTDFKGFTKIAETLSAQELVAEIDHCYSAFDEIILKHGLEKIKTIGDAYQAASGLPQALPDHADRAVVAALDINDWIKKYQQERKAAGRAALELRIGIHSGPVIAGVVGSQKFAYDIWGETVTLCEHIEALGEAGNVIISSNCLDLLKGQYETEPYNISAEPMAKALLPLKMFSLSRKTHSF